MQDVFINPRRAERGPDSPTFANWFGTTIRIYDPTIKAWRAHWFNPHDGIRADLIGRRHGNQIVQEGTFPDGTPIRWTFSEITEEGHLDIVHDLLSKWEQYANEQGYAFDYDAELYEKVDNYWRILDDGCATALSQ